MEKTEEEIRQDERKAIARWMYEDMYNDFIRRKPDGDLVMSVPIHFINRLADGIFPSDEAYQLAGRK